MGARWIAWLFVLAACHFGLDDVPEGPETLASGTPSRSGKRHRTCKQAFPSAVDEPSIATDARGRPAFAMYREDNCVADGKAVTCAASSWEASASCPVCLLRDPEGGLCVSTNIASLADPSVVSTRSGRCYGVLTAEAKQRACCADPPLSGVDCRHWPFPTASGPGQLCAYHTDCEGGLVCKELPYLAGVGLAGACACPEAEVEPDDANSADCEARP